MNKPLIYCLLLILTFVCCGQNQMKQNAENNTIAPDTIIESVITEGKEICDIENSSDFNLNEIISDTLIAMSIIDTMSTDSYKKFGLEFTGNCYACDLVSMIVTNTDVRLINVCGSEDEQNYKISGIQTIGNRIIIETNKTNFIFQKIDNSPIYKLVIKGKLEKNENLRMSEYFTTKKMLHKFEVHDCGDFQG